MSESWVIRTMTVRGDMARASQIIAGMKKRLELTEHEFELKVKIEVAAENDRPVGLNVDEAKLLTKVLSEKYELLDGLCAATAEFCSAIASLDAELEEDAASNSPSES